MINRVPDPFASLCRERSLEQSQALQRDFLRVVAGDQHAKSPEGLRRVSNRCGLLEDQMAKVELEGVFSEVRIQQYG
jgi:hypothetical protein